MDSGIIRGRSYGFFTVPIKLRLFSNDFFWLVVFNLSKTQALAGLYFSCCSTLKVFGVSCCDRSN